MHRATCHFCMTPSFGALRLARCPVVSTHSGGHASTHIYMPHPRQPQRPPASCSQAPRQPKRFHKHEPHSAFVWTIVAPHHGQRRPTLPSYLINAPRCSTVSSVGRLHVLHATVSCVFGGVWGRACCWAEVCWQPSCYTTTMNTLLTAHACGWCTNNGTATEWPSLACGRRRNRTA